MAIRNLLDRTPGSTIPGPACAVCRALASLPDEEAAALRQLLADPRWRYTELSDHLREDPDNPLDIHSDTLGRHAKGRCSAREKLR